MNPTMYYFLSSPYLFSEMDLAVQARIPLIKRLTHTSSGQPSTAPPPIPKSTVITRLRKTDSNCTAFSDEHGRIMLSTGVDRAISERPLLIYWTDGAQRFGPFSLMQSVSRHLAATAAASNSTPLSPTATVGQRDAHQFVMASGGSLGLNAHILDDKIAMQALLCSSERGRPPYIPWTVPFHTRAPDGQPSNWREVVTEILKGPPAFPNEYVIFKPSDSLKQRGILTVLRDPSKLDTVFQHVTTTTRTEINKTLFHSWVIQSFVVDPFMVSGLDLGLLINQTVPSHLQVPGTTASPSPPPPSSITSAALTHSIDRARSVSPTKKKPPFLLGSPSNKPVGGATAPSRMSRKKKSSSSVDSDLRPSTAAGLDVAPLSLSASIPAPSSFDPSTTNLFGPSTYTYDPQHVRYTPNIELPSDSALPIILNGMFKVHFRIYAIVKHDMETKQFDVYGCNLFKLYHAAQPSALLTTVRQTDNKSESTAPHHQHSDPYILLTAKTNTAASIPPIRHSPYMIDIRDVANFGCGVSNCLAMRLGNEILSPALVEKFLPKFHAIIRETTTIAIHAGGFGSFGLSRVGFQVLGYDFLYDTAADAPVLLEVNNNVGQGMFKKSEMLPQGMTDVQYSSLHSYWTKDYREPFCDGVVAAVLDPLYGLPSQLKPGQQPSFVHLTTIAQPECTPPPDLYAYSQGIPPPYLAKKRTMLSEPAAGTQTTTTVAPVAASVSESLLTTTIPPSDPIPKSDTTSSHFSATHSGSPASPFSDAISVRSLKLRSPSHVETASSVEEATNAAIIEPISLSPSHASSEIEGTVDIPDPISVSSSFPTPPSIPTSTPPNSLLLQRPPLTIRFTPLQLHKRANSSTPVAPQTVSASKSFLIEESKESKESSPRRSPTNFSPSPPPPTTSNNTTITIRRQGFQPPNTATGTPLYPAPNRISAPGANQFVKSSSGTYVLYPKRLPSTAIGSTNKPPQIIIRDKKTTSLQVGPQATFLPLMTGERRHSLHQPRSKSPNVNLLTSQSLGQSRLYQPYPQRPATTMSINRVVNQPQCSHAPPSFPTARTGRLPTHGRTLSSSNSFQQQRTTSHLQQQQQQQQHEFSSSPPMPYPIHAFDAHSPNSTFMSEGHQPSHFSYPHTYLPTSIMAN